MLSLLFSQLALAVYVCPQAAGGSPMPAMMQDGMPCAGMDMDQPALCAEHSAGAPQSFEVVKLPTPSLPAVVFVIEQPLTLDADAARSEPVPMAQELRPPPDPLFLATLRLRV